MKKYSVSSARQNLFGIMNEVLNKGIVVEIEKRGQSALLMKAEKVSKSERLRGKDWIIGDPDELVNLKVGEWTELKNL